MMSYIQHNGIIHIIVLNVAGRVKDLFDKITSLILMYMYK